jgi:phi13 family phage major tail protein
MTLGLKDLVYAPVTEGENGDSWGTPKRLAPALQADLSVTTADGTLYADDAVSEIAKEFVKATLKLGVKDLPPEVTAELLGQEVDDDKVVWAGADDEPPYVAVGFRAKKTGGKYKYVWLLKGKFKVPNESYKTKGESIEFNTPEIEGDFIKASTGKWKADYVGKPDEGAAKTWLTKVPEQSETIKTA